jgi:hypothetical protein
MQKRPSIPLVEGRFRMINTWSAHQHQGHP